MTIKEAYDKSKKEKCRILELEKIIATNPEYSYLYANEIIQSPFHLGEEAIASSIYYSYWYSNHVLKSRFCLGEKNISTDPGTSYHYAIYIIKGPFYLGHFSIFNSDWKDNYIDYLKSIDYDMNKISEWLL